MSILPIRVCLMPDDLNAIKLKIWVWKTHICVFNTLGTIYFRY